MNIQTIMLLFAILALLCFFGTMYGIQALVKQGRDPGKQLQLADTIVDTAIAANTTIKTFIPVPIENFIETVLKVTQAGVHSAQQLYDSGQILPGMRKERATQYAVNMLKLTGHEVTPELEQVIRGTAEAGVWVMKQNDPVITIAPVPDPLPPVEQPVINLVQPSV